jgi:ectoine hydroxylase-related dioxygenase (phytanoyl-CoA dioxygenase family)
MLNQAQLNAYRDDGFLVIPRVFDADTVGRMRAAVERLIGEAHGLTAHDARYDLDPTHTPDRPKVRRIKQPHLADPVFDEVMRNPTLIGWLAQLLPSGVRLKSSKLNMKEGGGGAPVEWHQDWAFYPHTNDDVLAVGVMLDDCRMENGPLLLLPGSHKGPVYDHHSDGCFCGAMDPAACDIDFGKAVASTGPAGSISIHHARLVHGSAENVSPDPRRLLLFEFTAADAWPLLGIGTLEEFDSRLLAGSPTIAPRLADVPVRMPLPPAPHQGSIYENQTTLKNRFFGRKAA